MAMVVANRTLMTIMPAFVSKLANVIRMVWTWPANMMMPMNIVMTCANRLLNLLIPQRDCKVRCCAIVNRDQHRGSYVLHSPTSMMMVVMMFFNSVTHTIS